MPFVAGEQLRELGRDLGEESLPGRGPQPQHAAVDARGACVAGSSEERRQPLPRIGEQRDDRGHEHAGIEARSRELGQGTKPGVRHRRAGLEPPQQRAVAGGERD